VWRKQSSEGTLCPIPAEGWSKLKGAQTLKAPVYLQMPVLVCGRVLPPGLAERPLVFTADPSAYLLTTHPPTHPHGRHSNYKPLLPSGAAHALAKAKRAEVELGCAMSPRSLGFF